MSVECAALHRLADVSKARQSVGGEGEESEKCESFLGVLKKVIRMVDK